MSLVDIVEMVFNGIPIIRRLWRWFWERDMELKLREPHSKIVRGQDGLNIPKGTKPILVVHVGENPHIFIWADLVLTNHRTSRKEVIRGCELHLKKRHLFFWEKTIASTPVLLDQVFGVTHTRKEWEPITIEPISSPVVIPVWADGEITYPIKNLPKRMKLVIEFSMVGPRRYMSKVVEDIIHNSSKLVIS